MGNIFPHKRRSHSSCSYIPNGEVNFMSFNILRSIGRGSYGKVCIAQKKDTKQMYAMKYMNKNQCIQEGAVANILQELRLLRHINHPYIVNLRYAFHDVEDMCLVVDLLQGGDLRYHLCKMERFSENDVFIYMLEISTALDYLHSKNIAHRDIKPDNLLLSLDGHVHLADFNVATKLENGRLSSSECGTWQYMAPEIFATSCGKSQGYSFDVDWWSLGVTCYELLHGQTMVELPKAALTAYTMLEGHEFRFSSKLNSSMISTLKQLLKIDPSQRLKSSANISSIVNIHIDDIKSGRMKPNFIPSMKKLNVDPAFELEELIIESKPIHKKEQRLSKTVSMDNTAQHRTSSHSAASALIEREFKSFDYEKRASTDDIIISKSAEEHIVHENDEDTSNEATVTSHSPGTSHQSAAVNSGDGIESAST